MIYVVRWDNTIEADSPLEAAKQALSDIQNSETLGFLVQEMDEKISRVNKEYSVDLSEDDEDAVMEIK